MEKKKFNKREPKTYHLDLFLVQEALKKFNSRQEEKEEEEEEEEKLQRASARTLHYSISNY